MAVWLKRWVYEERLGEPELPVRRRAGEGGVLSTGYRYLLEGCRQDSQDSSCRGTVIHQGVTHTREKMGYSDWVLCKKIHHEGDQILVWVTYEISILGNTQTLAGLDPE